MTEILEPEARCQLSVEDSEDTGERVGMGASVGFKTWAVNNPMSVSPFDVQHAKKPQKTPWQQPAPTASPKP
jgi:hypothetical protein